MKEAGGLGDLSRHGHGFFLDRSQLVGVWTDDERSQVLKSTHGPLMLPLRSTHAHTHTYETVTSPLRTIPRQSLAIRGPELPSYQPSPDIQGWESFIELANNM